MTRSAADQNLIDRALSLGCVPPPYDREDDPLGFARWDSAVSKVSALSRDSDACARRLAKARVEADRLAGHSEMGPRSAAHSGKPFVMPLDPLAGIAAALFGVVA